MLLSVCPELIFFLIFVFYVLTVVLLKGMAGSFLLSEGTLFLPWNQVDLVLGKSGQSFFWALVFKIRAILKNQSDSRK